MAITPACPSSCKCVPLHILTGACKDCAHMQLAFRRKASSAQVFLACKENPIACCAMCHPVSLCGPVPGDIQISSQPDMKGIEYGGQLVTFIRIRLTGIADNFNKSPQPV